MKSRADSPCWHATLKIVSVLAILLGLWLGFGGRSIDPIATSAIAEAIAPSASTKFQTIAIRDIVAGQFVTVGLPGNQSQPLPEDTLTEKAPKQEAIGVTEWLEYPGDAFVPYPIRIAVRDGVIADVDGKDTNASLRDLISTKYIVGDVDGTDVTRLLCRTIDLEMPKPDGSVAELSVVRPLWWLQGTGAAVGGSIDIGLHEIGLSGEATVLAIGPCDVDSRETRSGMSIVTGKIRHRNATVWDLTFDGRTEETLGVTANHPLYSETRHAWIPAGELQLDEVVRTLNSKSTLTARTQRPTRETVFNIEVHRSHAYHVSSIGVLAHNNNILICSNESAFHPALRTRVATTPGGILGPGDVVGGFMTRDGKLLIHGNSLKVGGHEALAERLAVSNLRAKIRSGDIIPFAIGKSSTGKFSVWGSQSMSQGIMSEATKKKIISLFE